MLEDEVLAVLWTLGRPVSPAAVQLELADRLAYTAVMLTLTRLHRKGLVTREPTARGGYAYTPTMEEAAYAAQAMTELLGRRHDRAGALTRFLSSLTQKTKRSCNGGYTRKTIPDMPMPMS
jgi:predicted transcriptional regulator